MQEKRFKYAATKGGNNCYCGDEYSLTRIDANCDKPCAGDSGEMCGGTNAMQLYDTGPFNVLFFLILFFRFISKSKFDTKILFRDVGFVLELIHQH